MHKKTDTRVDYAIFLVVDGEMVEQVPGTSCERHGDALAVLARIRSENRGSGKTYAVASIETTTTRTVKFIEKM